MSRWIEIDVERTLTIDRGRDVILCDRSNAPNGETLLVLISDEAIQKLREQLTSGKAKAAGVKGGQARASTLSPERRSEIARTAATTRWGGHDT